MKGLRFYLALWLAKISIPALKLTHHNGTDYPGHLAIKICPDFLDRIEKPPHAKLAPAARMINGYGEG